MNEKITADLAELKDVTERVRGRIEARAVTKEEKASLTRVKEIETSIKVVVI